MFYSLISRLIGETETATSSFSDKTQAKLIMKLTSA